MHNSVVAAWDGDARSEARVGGGVEQGGPVLPVVDGQDDRDGVQKALTVEDAGDDDEPDRGGQGLGAAGEQEAESQCDSGHAEHAQRGVSAGLQRAYDGLAGGEVRCSDDVERVPAEDDGAHQETRGQDAGDRDDGGDGGGREFGGQQAAAGDRGDVQVTEDAPVPVGRSDRGREQGHDDRQQ